MAVPYVQRKIDVCDEMSTSSMVAAFYGNDLHGLLFHPIAGDSMQPRTGAEDPDMGAMLSMKQLQFGLLDPDMMRDLSVAHITNGSCAEVLGGLSDLRMGATPHGQACQTCGHHPDIFLFQQKIPGAIITIVRATLDTSSCHSRLSIYCLWGCWCPS